MKNLIQEITNIKNNKYYIIILSDKNKKRGFIRDYHINPFHIIIDYSLSFALAPLLLLLAFDFALQLVFALHDLALALALALLFALLIFIPPTIMMN